MAVSQGQWVRIGDGDEKRVAEAEAVVRAHVPRVANESSSSDVICMQPCVAL